MRWITLIALFILLLSTGGGSIADDKFVSKACDVCPEMVLIPAGTFRMGDISGEGSEKERPVHRVEIRAFALGRYEVTFTQYDAFTRATSRSSLHDNGWGRGSRPAINVTWDEAKAYVKWLSDKTGKRFRLPSESEWEYAARAGTTTKYSFGNREKVLCDYANHADISTDYNQSNKTCSDGVGRQTATVGNYQPNAFDLFDVHGNVWEWVEDCQKGSFRNAPSNGGAWTNGTCHYRVLRGGSWADGPWILRSASRHGFPPDWRYKNLGFRVAQDL